MESTLIGHVTDIVSNRFTVNLLTDDNGYSPIINVGENPVLVGQIGTHVSIQQRGVHVLASVTHTWEERNNGEIQRFMECLPLGEVVSDDKFCRGINQYPITGAEVYLVNEDEMQSLFSNNAGYNFSMGHLKNHPEVKVFLDPNPLFATAIYRRPLRDRFRVQLTDSRHIIINSLSAVQTTRPAGQPTRRTISHQPCGRSRTECPKLT